MKKTIKTTKKSDAKKTILVYLNDDDLTLNDVTERFVAAKLVNTFSEAEIYTISKIFARLSLNGMFSNANCIYKNEEGKIFSITLQKKAKKTLFQRIRDWFKK